MKQTRDGRNIISTEKYKRYINILLFITSLAPAVQKLDSVIHRINHYPVDKY